MRWLALLSLAAAVLALVLGGYLWQELERAKQEMARRATDATTQATEARTLAGQADTLTQTLQARLSVAEVRLSEVSLQRSQLDELMLSLSRSRDDSLLQDIESALRLAEQQTQLTGSVQPLISALQAADQRIARAAQPRLNPVQRAIARDIERIQEAALLDVPALTQRLDELMRQVDGLTLAQAVGRASGAGLAAASAQPTEEPSPPTPSSPAAAQPESQEGATALPADPAVVPWLDRARLWWGDLLGRVWLSTVEQGGQLVRVSRIDHPEAALLAPEQGFFLRENLKLQLLNARLAVLARQMDTARADVRAVDATLARYFEPETLAYRQVREGLQRLQEELRDVALPRPDESLAALGVAAMTTGGR
ncbi:MAG: uroporphyrinogen-III C-methyltransferase [Serpentinimonas sp.]|nr:uroporphyrinogen-III C-methyltransferase [Serpentinimonas sp.]